MHPLVSELCTPDVQIEYLLGCAEHNGDSMNQMQSCRNVSSNGTALQ